MTTQPSQLPQIFGLLDVGTSKVVCLMLARADGGDCTVIGLGHQKSRGLKASVVVDSEAAEDAVRATVAQAEHMAGVALDAVVMSASCGRLASSHFTVGLDLGGRTVASADLDRLVAAGREHVERDDRASLHLNAIGARLDGYVVPGHALGLAGQRLALDVHAVSADGAPLRYLQHVAERCQLTVAAIAPAPLASALAVTDEDDRQRGAVVVDCGAGTTSLAVFLRGSLVAASVIPIGGNHITYDLTRALDTTIIEAERIKKNHAIQSLAQPMQDDAIAYQPRGENRAPSKQVTRAQITTIITSRLDALLRQIQQRLEFMGLAAQSNVDVFLTGGGSVLFELAERAGVILGRSVRIVSPLNNGCLPKALLQPAFATIAGLQAIALDPGLGRRLAYVPVKSSERPWHEPVWRRRQS